MADIEYLIATKILDWYEHYEDMDSPTAWYKDGEFMASHWRPLLSMEDAWRVMEKFDESLVRKRFNFESNGSYRAWVKHNHIEFTAMGRTANEAICKVALKAYRIEVEDA